MQDLNTDEGRRVQQVVALAALAALGETITHCLSELARALSQPDSAHTNPPVLADAERRLAQIDGALMVTGQHGLAALVRLVNEQLTQNHLTSSVRAGEITSQAAAGLVQRLRIILQRAIKQCLLGKTRSTAELLCCWQQLLLAECKTSLHPAMLVSLELDADALDNASFTSRLAQPSGTTILDLGVGGTRVADLDVHTDADAGADQLLLNLLRAQEEASLRDAAGRLSELFDQAAARTRQPETYWQWQALKAYCIEYAVAGGEAGRIKKIMSAAVRLLRWQKFESTTTSSLMLIPAASEQSKRAASVVRQQSTRLSDDLASVTRDALFELAQRPTTSEPAREVAGVFRLTQQFQLSNDGFLTDWSVEDALATLANTADTQIAAIESDAASIDDPKIWIHLAEMAASRQALQHLAVAINRVAEQCAQQSLNTHHRQALAVVLICLRESLSLKKLTHAMSLVHQALLSTDGSSCPDQLGPSWRAHHAPDLMQALTSAMQADMTHVALLIDGEVPVDLGVALHTALRVLDRVTGALHLLGLANQYAQIGALAGELRQVTSASASEVTPERFARQWVWLQTLITQLGWQPVHDAYPDQILSPADTQLDTIFVEEARVLIQAMRDYVARSDGAGLIQAAHTLGGCSATVGLTGLATLALALESLLEHQSLYDIEMDWILIDAVIDAADDLLQCFALSGERGEHQDWVQRLQSSTQTEHAQQNVYQEHPINQQHQLQQARQEPHDQQHESDQHDKTEAPEDSDNADQARQADEADEADELYEIFKLEAADLLPQLEEALLHWQQHPDDTPQATRLLRVLHTLKGSARMAGHTELGNEFHQAETQVSIMQQQAPHSIVHEIIGLRQQVDRWAYAIMQTGDAYSYRLSAEDSTVGDAVDDYRVTDHHSAEVRSATHADQADTISIIGSVATLNQPDISHVLTRQLDGATSEQSLTSTAASVPSPTTKRAPMLRVRADRLAQFADTGAEIWSSNARLREGLQVQRRALLDLADDLSRLRAQLRELEIEAESRVLACAHQGASTEFDPLEFDQYTRLHELTRMMTESMTDVVGVQRGMLAQLEQLSTAAAEQQRDVRRHQAELQHLRSQPLHTVEPRLRHVLRQAAREVGCEVALVIKDGTVEIERDLLDRLLGPLEHLLRNAVVHGIEHPEQRIAIGKSAVGCVTLRAIFTGNELQLLVQDDGRGLNLDRIQEQAIAAGLISAADVLNPRELSELIFTPGFSTASELTTLSGRGIGLDAVRSELHSLGGQISVDSEAGRGCRFNLRLPVGLASLHVVVVRAGPWRVGLPASLVRQAMQIDASGIAAEGQQHYIEWQGERLPLQHLARNLGHTTPSSVSTAQGRVPIAVLSDGEKTIALQLDLIEGQRELIVKHPGPQLSSVPGLIGASVLADGVIALIIHPLRLPAVVLNIIQVDAVQTPAVASVLVVDDSLTVRRATQRLLERHGYVVELARDGVEALAFLHRERPAVILLDIEMPRMDGFELLATLRDDARWRDLPVVMITSRIADRHRERATQLGANAYMGKPYHEEALLGLLTEILDDERSAQKRQRDQDFLTTA